MGTTQSVNPFRILEEPERSSVVVANKRYLLGKGWAGIAEGIPYNPLYFLEDPNMPIYMARIESEMKRALSIQRLFWEPMIVHPKDMPPVTDEEVLKHVTARLRAFIHFYQAIYYLAALMKRMLRAFTSVLWKSPRMHMAKILQLIERRFQKTTQAIEALPDEWLRTKTLTIYHKTVERLRARSKEKPGRGFMGFFVMGYMSDDLFEFATTVIICEAHGLHLS